MCAQDLTKLIAFLHLWRKVLQNTPQDIMTEHLKTVTKVFEDCFHATSRQLAGLETHMEPEDHTRRIESCIRSLGNSFVELTVKLNEHSFRPLLRKTIDWAFGEAAGADQGNIAVFCGMFTQLVEYFKVTTSSRENPIYLSGI
jgi:hypothetical protein